MGLETENLLSEYQRTKRKVKQLSKSIVKNKQNDIKSKNTNEDNVRTQTPSNEFLTQEVNLEMTELGEEIEKNDEAVIKEDFETSNAVSLSEKIHQMLTSKEGKRDGIFISLITSPEHERTYDKIIELLKLDRNQPFSTENKSTLSQNHDSAVWSETHENLILNIQTAGLRIGRETALLKLTAELASAHNSSVNSFSQTIESLCNYNDSFITISYETILSLLQLLDNSTRTQNNTKIQMKSVMSEKEQAIKEKNKIQEDLMKYQEDWKVEKQNLVSEQGNVQKKCEENAHKGIDEMKKRLELIHYNELNQIRNDLENDIKQKKIAHEDTINKCEIENRNLSKQLNHIEEKIVQTLKKEIIDIKKEFTESHKLQKNKEKECITEIQSMKQELNDKKKSICKMKGEFITCETNAKKEKDVLNDKHKEELKDIELKVKNIICSLEEKIQLWTKRAFDAEKRAEDAEHLLLELDQSLVNVDNIKPDDQ